MEVTERPRIAVLPSGEVAALMEAAVRAGGLEPRPEAAGSSGLVWCSTRPDGLGECLEAGGEELRWVQLPYAGIEAFLPYVDDRRIWTCAKDIYGQNVAEFTLGLLLVAFRRLDRYVRATTWERHEQHTLEGAEVTILGGGGIGRSLTHMLVPLAAKVTVVSRSGRPVDGAVSLGLEQMMPAVGRADAVVLALPLTDATRGLVDSGFLKRMRPSAWLVNVARGGIVVTDDLVAALRRGEIGGAALDVTDPEPLPDGHPLWQLENVLVTPHIANTPEIGLSTLVALVTENCRRFSVGEALLGLVDPTSGY